MSIIPLNNKMSNYYDNQTINDFYHTHFQDSEIMIDNEGQNHAWNE